jgi:tRNA(Ile)-lysidine synthase
MWRNWEPGDRYVPVGSAGEKKIATLFQEARIPLWERSRWPVLTMGDSIVWTRRFGPAAGFEARPETRVLLRIRERSCDPIEIGIGLGRDGV